MQTSDLALHKLPPQHVEAEQCVLGAILLENEALLKALEILRPENFYRDAHRKIFEAILTLFERNEPIDLLTLTEALRKRNQLEDIGGATYLATLLEAVPTAANVRHHARLVRETGILRSLINAATEIIAESYEHTEDVEELLDHAERLIFEISEKRVNAAFINLKDLLKDSIRYTEQLYERHELITGLPTGYHDFDQLTAGLQPSDLIIIAGRPGMGKCVSADSEIVLADGSVETIGEIYRRRRAQLLTLCDNWQFGFTQPSAFVDDGLKPVYRVITRLGRTIESTLSHPFLTLGGWRPLGELKPGVRVAMPRRIDVFGTQRLRDGQVKVLAYLLGDGSLTGTSPAFTNTNPRIQQDFAQALAELPGPKLCVSTSYYPSRSPSFRATRDLGLITTGRQQFARRLSAIIQSQPRGTSGRLAKALAVTPSAIRLWAQGKCVPRSDTFARLCDYLGAKAEELAPDGPAAISWNSKNPLTLWLEEMGLWGKGAHDKSIPALVFQLTRSQMALFLNRLFATDGWVALTKDQNPQVGYATVSERLARQLQHLLLRFGIITRLRKRISKYQGTHHVSWQLTVTHADSIRTFASEIGIFTQEEKLARALQILDKERNQTNRDLIPVEVWEMVAQAKGDEAWCSLARRAGFMGYTNIHVGKRALTRKRVLALATAVDNEPLQNIASSDVYWDEIVTIELSGLKQVYDLTIPGTHNFVANDICVHNTSFALNIARNVGVKVKGPREAVAIFSLEMSKEQLALRMLCGEARIDSSRLRRGYLDKTEWGRLVNAANDLSEAPIFIDDSPVLTVLDIRAKARRLQAEHGLSLIIVDYLQLIRGRGRVESRQQEISEISRSLKALAKELKVPVVALSQLSRAVEQRGDRRPQLADLRESGAIEQDSDLIVFIYRDEIYNKDTKDKGIAEVIVGKQRNGPIDTVKLAFLKEYARFENLETRREPF